jgi:alpha-L-fucosidase
MKTPFIITLIVSASLCVAAETAKTYTPPPQFSESAEQHTARMAWFRDAHFGMFIHWGLYSELAGEWKDKTIGGGAEWIQQQLGIPSSEYAPLAKKFNPVKFDAHAWIKLMKRAGVKYIAVTTKHHDGFCLWPTKVNDDWNIGITPFKRDPLKELSQACEAEGVRFGIYHSIPDWHHADWPGRPKFNNVATDTPDKERYKYEYLFPQLKELLTNYGKVHLIWLDNGGMCNPPAWTQKDGRELENYIRTLAPEIVMDDRSKAGVEGSVHGAKLKAHAGDYISPEGWVPPTGFPGVDWETCQTMQLPNNWGYNRLVGFRSFKDLLQQLVDVTSKGGNMLLNIGPDGEGEILPQARQCLDKCGDWMEVNAESIHGTRASPFDRLPFNGRCTQKPGKLYLHIFAWPADGKLVVPVTNKVKKAYLLADAGRGALSAEGSPRGATIALPAQAPDTIDSVVVVELEGAPQVTAQPKNLSLGKPVEVSSVWPGRKELDKSHITDGKLETTWAAEEKAREAWVIVDLQSECEVSEAMLSDAPYHRTRAFDLEAEVAGEWKTIASGKTIGDELQRTFAPVKARRFRLNIRKASDTPTLAEFQLFGKPE